MASSFNIINETMMTQLLLHSFEEKVAKLFRTLAPQSITTWGELCQDFIKSFTDDGDDNTFLSLIACIKRCLHETVDDFNIHFEKN